MNPVSDRQGQFHLVPLQMPDEMPFRGRGQRCGPLGELLRPGALYLQSGVFDGIEHWYYALDWQGRHVWGATAGMLNNLVELLAGE